MPRVPIRQGGPIMDKITKRGAFVLGVTVGLLIVGAFWLMGNYWVTESGICIGSMAECNI